MGHDGRPTRPGSDQRAAALCRRPTAAGDPRDWLAGFGSRYLVAMGNQPGGRRLSRKRFLPVFINEEGRPFVPTAKRVWICC